MGVGLFWMSSLFIMQCFFFACNVYALLSDSFLLIYFDFCLDFLLMFYLFFFEFV